MHASAHRRPSHLVITAVLLFAGAAVAQGPPAMVPFPKSVAPAEGTLPLPTPTFSISPKDGAGYVFEVLTRALGDAARQVREEWAVVRVRCAQGPGELAKAAEALGLETPPEDRWQEAFVLDAGVGSPESVTLTGGPVGIIYGAYLLEQLLVRKGDALSVQRVALSDWPDMLTRGFTGCPRDVSPRSLRTLDWLARWRINAAYYEIYGDQGQDGAPPEVADIQRECARRGITLYGLISNWRTERLLGRELCASNPEDLARIRRYSEELLDRGCQGLIFLFDDITQQAVEHTSNCELCRARFDGLAAVQLELMRPMLEVARERDITRLIVCPTPYYQGWRKSYDQGKLDGERYYATWRDAEQIRGVQVFHCLLREQDLAEVQAAGLRNFIYWYNGGYEYAAYAPGGQLPPGMWGGFTQLAYGWYACRWDPSRGVVPREDTYESFRTLPRLTQHAWICGGGDYPWALWGCYCWDAVRHDPERTETELLKALFGGVAAEAYRRWRDAIRTALPTILAPPNVSDPTLRDALFADLERARDQATVAAEEFQAAMFGAGVADDTLRQETADRMVSTARALHQQAITAAASRTTVGIGEVSETQVGQAVQREQRLEIGSFWSRYALRYSQTQEPDGSLHRSQWHFGSGLGMVGPSYRNWYDAGFVDVLLDGQSLDAFAPVFSVVEGPQGQELVGTWETDAGTVELRFSLLDGGLRLDGKLTSAAAPRLSVQLFAIPSAGWGWWEDMDKFVVTESGEAAHGTPVTLEPGADWIFLADRTYDVPREGAEGPCAVLFGPPIPVVRCDNGSYVVQVDAEYPPGTHEFSLVVWDFHGQRNEEALAQFRESLSGYGQKLAEPR